MLKNILFILCICLHVQVYAQPNDQRSTSEVYRDKERKAYNDAYLESTKRNSSPVNLGGGIDKNAAEQLAEQWKKNSGKAGLTWAEAEAQRKAAEPARKAQEEKERIEAERFNALKEKWAAEDVAREPARIPIRKRYRDAGFTANESQAFAGGLAIDPARGRRMFYSDAEAAEMEAALIAKKKFDKELNTASFETLHGYIQKFYFAGESNFMALRLLRDRFPEKSGQLLNSELSAIAYILGNCYDNRLFLGAKSGEEMNDAARKRFWELFEIAPAETMESNGKYCQASDCPLLYEMNLLNNEYTKSPEKRTELDQKKHLMQDVLLRIRFVPHGDGSYKTSIQEIQVAGYEIGKDKKRFLAYTNEDWVNFGYAQRKSAQEMVRYIMWCRSHKETQKTGEKILKRLEKAGVQ